MKKFLSLVALLTSLQSFAQVDAYIKQQQHIIDSMNALPKNPVKTTLDIPVDSSTGKIKFAGVADAPGKKAAAILSSVNSALLKSNAFTDKTIVISDTATGEFTMRCKSELLTSFGSLCFINYLVTVYTKEGRFKYILTNFVHEGCDRQGLPPMKSTGELENAMVSTPGNRGYYDNMLTLSKTVAENVIAEIKAGVLKNDERNF